MFKRLLKPLWSDTRAAAAVEFALAVPFIILLFAGATDLLRLLLVHQKVERIAYSTADLVAQSDGITAGQLAQIWNAPREIMQPFVFGERGRVILSSVHREVGEDDAEVRWRCAGGGTLEEVSRLASVGSVTTLPGGLTINERENVIVAEVFYVFDNFLPIDFVDVGVVYKTAVFKPRFGSLLTAPC